MLERRVKGLNRRNVEYILTPRGFAEKVRKAPVDIIPEGE